MLRLCLQCSCDASRPSAHRSALRAKEDLLGWEGITLVEDLSSIERKRGTDNEDEPGKTHDCCEDIMKDVEARDFQVVGKELKGGGGMSQLRPTERIRMDTP